MLTILLAALLPLRASADPSCSPLNHCHVKKITYAKQGWKTLIEKEFKFEKLCVGDRPSLEIEKDLGIELWAFNGNGGDAATFMARPYVTVDLYTYKLTYVVAKASVPMEASAVAFEHRLKPRGKELVQISCDKQ